MSAAASSPAVAPADESFDWVELKRQLDHESGAPPPAPPRVIDRVFQDFQDNPFVPIGCGLTVTFLVGGLFSFTQKRSDLSQLMMRGRIAAQGFTIMALLGGVVMSMRKKAAKK